MEKKINSINDGLLDSAFRFLRKAVSEFNEDHEISLVHFAIFLELFLKYRLTQEHWSLIIKSDQNNPPDIKKYLQGDFKSADANILVPTIEKATEDVFSENEKQLYKDVFKHRNQIVHFYSIDSLNEKAKVAGLIVKGWAYVIHRIKNFWQVYFNNHQTILDKIVEEIQTFKQYFIERYQVIKPELDDLANEGTTIIICPYCDQVSFVESFESDNDLIFFDCLVCNSSEYLLSTICSKCGKTCFSSAEDDYCECDHKLFETPPNGYRDYKYGSECEWRCPTCYDSDVIYRDSTYICMRCGEASDSLYCCDWCNETIMGQKEETYFSGCDFCEGKSGHMRDD